MSVYIIRDINGHIKIGSSDDHHARLRSFQTAHAGPLDVLAVLPGGLGLERELHKKFAADRIGGEWFRASDRIVGFIEGLTYAKDVREFFEEVCGREIMGAAERRLLDDMLEGIDPTDPLMTEKERAVVEDWLDRRDEPPDSGPRAMQ